MAAKHRDSGSNGRNRDGNGNGNGNAESRAGAQHDSQIDESSEKEHRPAASVPPDFRVVVIGTSAGGVEALMQVMRGLPPHVPAAFFVVLHISADAPSMLPEILGRATRMTTLHPHDGEPIRPGRVYIAPPGHHMLIKPGRILLSRGPRENNARPAIDPLFRTAARCYGPHAVGVVLSGGLDDGTVGLMQIKRDGGVAIVQDPRTAMFPSMPASAIENVGVDHVLPLEQIGPQLGRLCAQPIAARQGALNMARAKCEEPDVAEVGTDVLKSQRITGPPSTFTCPECGGSLWELQSGKVVRYRCHVGHGYTADTLMSAQAQTLEDALWSALRALEENAAMRRRMAQRVRKGNLHTMAQQYDEQAHAAEIRAKIIRSVLTDGKIKAAPGSDAEEKALHARDEPPYESQDTQAPPPAKRSKKPRRATRGSARRTRKSAHGL